ncbi:MAG: NAD(+)/NADH kinase [Flavobacteriales bacterium]|nr:NAD(+)/NADH kinase [Flavobacteriales bacterium]
MATFPTDQVPADLDLVISLGGDGTFLRSVGLVARQGIPVLGVNLGRLGFLAAIRTEELDEALEHLSKRQFTLEERILLSLEGCDAEFEGNTLALNDVSFHKRDTSSMITVNTYVDGRFLNTYWADGLIIATHQLHSLLAQLRWPHPGPGLLGGLGDRPGGAAQLETCVLRGTRQQRGAHRGGSPRGQVPGEPGRAKHHPERPTQPYRAPRGTIRQIRTPAGTRLLHYPAQQVELGVGCPLGAGALNNAAAR